MKSTAAPELLSLSIHSGTAPAEMLCDTHMQVIEIVVAYKVDEKNEQ